MNIQLEFEYLSRAEALRRFAELLEDEYGKEKAQTLAYKIPESIEEFTPRLLKVYREIQMHYLLENFKEIVNGKDTYRKGDLWILGDAVEIENDISKETYRRLEDV